MTGNDPFASPATATGIRWADHLGDLLVIDVLGVETGIRTVHGDADAIRADVHVLDGDHATYLDCLVFPKVLCSQLRSRVGQKVLGRLGQGAKKPGQDAPWLILDPTAEDRAAGLAWLGGRFAAPVTSAPPEAPTPAPARGQRAPF